MAVKQPAKPRRRFHFGWRGPAVFLLTLLGVLFLTGYTMVHWTERQVLTTDNWVKIVGPLPKNEEVASSLSQYTVSKLFTSSELETKIEQALPEQAAFLAPTLADRLKARLTNVTENVIRSDQFQNIWIVANKTAHERLINRGRGIVPPNQRDQKPTFDVDLSSVRDNIRTKLGITSAPLFSGPNSADQSKKVDLKGNIDTKLSMFSKFVKSIDFLNKTLWMFALVFLLASFILTRFRRRLLLIVIAAILAVSLLQVNGLNAVRPAILDHIQNQAYRPAAGITYDALTDDFLRAATTVAIISAILLLAVFFTQQKFLKHSKFITNQIKAFRQSRFNHMLKDSRVWIKQYRWWISGGLVLLSLILGAFALKLDWQGAVRLASATLIVIELVFLAAPRPLLKSKN